MSAAASIAARPAQSGTAVARTGPWLRRLLEAGLERWIAWRDERILMQATACELRDIGLDRRDIRRAVRGELRRRP
jgi:uncharacterized protein YjiS (DUF1127 family)